jgi:hypothetical protein
MPRVSADVGYFRRSYGNFLVVDNRAVTASDFAQFSVTTPVDARLPGGGGQVISGLYNVNPDRFGLTDNYQTFAKNYGSQSERWDGVDVNLRARFAAGALLQGGVSTGRTVTDNCDLMGQLPEINPTGAHQCYQDRGFITQVKALGTYTIPRVDVQVAATFQSLPGPLLSANVTVGSAAIAPSLGRPLSGGTSNVTVNVIDPGALYGERMNQLDLRVAKLLRFGRSRTTIGMDIFNATNANPVLAESSTYTVWRQPQSILLARYARFSVQVDF